MVLHLSNKSQSRTFSDVVIYIVGQIIFLETAVIHNPLGKWNLSFSIYLAFVSPNPPLLIMGSCRKKAHGCSFNIITFINRQDPIQSLATAGW